VKPHDIDDFVRVCCSSADGCLAPRGILFVVERSDVAQRAVLRKLARRGGVCARGLFVRSKLSAVNSAKVVAVEGVLLLHSPAGPDAL